MDGSIWEILGPLLGGYVAIAGAITSYLIKQNTELARSKDALYEKILTQSLPALERASAAVLSTVGILEQGAAAMGAMTETGKRMEQATSALLTQVAVLSDRQGRDRRPPASRT